MLFTDRLEVWNPGRLPPSLTLADLRRPHSSIPGNPLLAEPLYLAKYIERMGTGARDMIAKCRAAGLPEPEFALTDSFVITIRRPTPQVTGQVTGQVDSWIERVLRACREQALKSKEIQNLTGIKHRETFQRNYLDHLLDHGWIERTIPENPTNRIQKYRLTPKGLAMLKELETENDPP